MLCAEPVSSRGRLLLIGPARFKLCHPRVEQLLRVWWATRELNPERLRRRSGSTDRRAQSICACRPNLAERARVERALARFSDLDGLANRLPCQVATSPESGGRPEIRTL